MAVKKSSVIISFEALDKISGPLRQVNRRLENFQAPFKRLNNQMTRFGKASGLSTLASWATRAGVALTGLGIAGAYGLKRLSDRATELGSTIHDVSKKTGFNSTALQQWGAVAKDVGSDQESLNNGLVFFSKALSQARRGQGALVEAVGKGNPFLNNLIKIKDVTTAFEYFMDQVGSMKNEQDQIALSQAAFGRGSDLVGLAQMSKTDREAIRKKTPVLSPEEVKLLDDWGDKQAALANKFSVLSARAFVKLLPTMERLADKFDKFISGPDFDRLVYALENVVPAVANLAENILTLLSYLGFAVRKGDEFLTGDRFGNGDKRGVLERFWDMMPGVGMLQIPKMLLGSGNNAQLPPPTNASTPKTVGTTQPTVGVTVDFRNLPRGVKVDSKNPMGIDFSMSQGLSMGGM